VAFVIVIVLLVVVVILLVVLGRAVSVILHAADIHISTTTISRPRDAAARERCDRRDHNRSSDCGFSHATPVSKHRAVRFTLA
jgi:hypothetical protein